MSATEFETINEAYQSGDIEKIKLMFKRFDDNPIYKRIEETLNCDITTLISLDISELSGIDNLLIGPDIHKEHDQKFIAACSALNDIEKEELISGENDSDKYGKNVFFHYLKDNEFIRIYRGTVIPDLENYITISKRSPLGQIFVEYLKIAEAINQSSPIISDLERNTPIDIFVTDRDITFHNA